MIQIFNTIKKLTGDFSGEGSTVEVYINPGIVSSSKSDQQTSGGSSSSDIKLAPKKTQGANTLESIQDIHWLRPQPVVA